jgi:hypothetical protein
MQLLRCSDCEEVIGVYEPLVLVMGGHARTTSRAAEPKLQSSFGTYYHRDCYINRGRHGASP